MIQLAGDGDLFAAAAAAAAAALVLRTTAAAADGDFIGFSLCRWRPPCVAGAASLCYF